MNNQNKTEYYKRDNSVYADPFIYDSVIKLQQDSFVIAEYKNPFNAYVYRGIINKDNKKLIVVESKAISLNTGGLINIENEQSTIEFVLTKSKFDEIEIRKYQDGDLDSTYRYRPYKAISQLNKLEKWFFDENSSSEVGFWSIKSQNQPIPPKPVMIESEKLLKIEVGKLMEQRQNKLDNLLKEMVTNCSTEVKDSIVLSLIVESDGEIENYNILKASKSAKLKVDCLNEFLGQTKMNLGMLKVVPSARSPIAQKVTYTLPIR
jgi:hypothetical protein